MGGQRNTIGIERVIAELAGHQAGAVGHTQLVVRGASPRTIEGALRRGLIERMHRGVYVAASVHRTRETLWHAADLTGGSLAGISHHDALAAWGCVKPTTGPVHLTSTTARRPRPGIHLHRAPLPTGDWVRRDGLRLTMPARTLIDLAACYDRRALQLALDEAHFRGLVSATTLAEALGRNRGRPGMKALPTLLRTHELGTTRTTTGLEEHVFGLLTGERLTGFVCQHPIGPYTADFYYPAQGLVVEADGANAHGRASRWESDARRDAQLRDWGYEVVRIPEAEAYGDPRPALARVSSALTSRSASSPANGLTGSTAPSGSKPHRE